MRKNCSSRVSSINEVQFSPIIGFGDVLPNMSALFYTYLIIGLAIVFMNIILVKIFVESVCQILRKEFKRELR